MKNLLVMVFFSFPILCFAQKTSLTLEDCIELAIENNENLRNAYLEEKISKALNKEYLSI